MVSVSPTNAPTIEVAPEYAPLAALHLLLIFVCLALYPIWIPRRFLWPLTGRPLLLDSTICACIVVALACLVVNQLKGTIFFALAVLTFSGFMMMVAYVIRVLWIKAAFQIAEKQQQIALGTISSQDPQVLSWLKAAKTRRSWPVTVGILIACALFYAVYVFVAYGILGSYDVPNLFINAGPIFVLAIGLVVPAFSLRAFPDDGYDMRSEQRKIGLVLVICACLYIGLQAYPKQKYARFLFGPIIADFFFAFEILEIAVIPLYKSFPRAPNVNSGAHAMNLVMIMGNTKALEQLRAFTMAEWSGENLRFLEAASAFTANYTDRVPDENLKVATEIIGAYIVAQAPLQVNISAETAFRIPSRLVAANAKGEPIPSDLFHGALREIHDLVERDTMPRFRRFVSTSLDKGVTGFEWVQEVAARQAVLASPFLALMVSETQGGPKKQSFFKK